MSNLKIIKVMSKLGYTIESRETEGILVSVEYILVVGGRYVGHLIRKGR